MGESKVFDMNSVRELLNDLIQKQDTIETMMIAGTFKNGRSFYSTSRCTVPEKAYLLKFAEHCFDNYSFGDVKND